MNIHKDVLQIIRNDYYSKIENGTPLIQSEMIDLIRINEQIIDQDLESVDRTREDLKEFEMRYKELLDRHLLTFKLFNGFLQLHDLEYEFDNYFERIQRKMNKLNLS